MTYHHRETGFVNLWQQRTTLEKVLIVLYLVIGTAILASLAIFFMIFGRSTEKNVCETVGCINAASRILSTIDSTVKPCDDFYQFSCGNFIKNTFIPDDKLAMDTFSDLSDKIDIQLRTLIDEEIHANESKVFTLAKKLHKSCMNRTAVELRGLDPFKKILSTFGGWPVVEENRWNETAWDWIDALRKMRRIGLTTNYLISTSVSNHLKNSSMRTLQVDQPELGLAREFLLDDKDKIVQNYFEYMVDTAVIFGANHTVAKIELLDALNFERAIASISTPAEERRNGEAQYNPHTIADLQTKYPHIRWLEYINALMPKDMVISDREVVVVVTPTYFERLAHLLQKTSKRTISNYFMWRTVYVTSNFLNDEVRIRKVAYMGSMTGQNQRGQAGTSQWKECVAYTTSTLSVSVGALYVRKYFNEATKHHAVEIVENIRNSFIEMLQKVAWMDDITKNAAVAKAKALVTHIAYPDELTNNTKLEEYYRDLEIEEDEYLMNALRLNFFKTEYAVRELYAPVNKTDWLQHATPAMTNAFYSAIENSIQFPAGILQGQFLSNDRPNYLNYGGIGQIIGHEITHGFDDLGRQFDKNGNLVDWWKSETKEKFLNRTKCIIDQYSNFTDPTLKINVNGKTSQGENMADNGGMKSAYFAYNQWAHHHGGEQSLPGLPYTAQQMFWIASAQTWCSTGRDWYTKMTITVDTHAPSRFRVLGSVKNNKEFSKDFNCAIGAPMNPTEKCEIW